MRHLLFLFTFILQNGILLFAGDNPEDPQIIWPLIQKDHLLSGTFGEYRPDHFHLGLDLRTPGQTGVPVCALADGYISQIWIRPNGYGRVLFLTYNSLRIAVYCHLQSFNKELERFLLDRQYETHSFSQDILLTPEDFPFKKGDIIAYSGRSGTIRPHLHLEIRSPQGYALNPLTQGLSVVDTHSPIITKLAIIPLPDSGEVEGDCRPRVYKTVKGEDGKYHLKELPRIFGEIVFAVSSRDYANGSANPLAFYSAQVAWDDSLIFTLAFDSCALRAFSQSEIDRDPYLRASGRGDFLRLFSYSNGDSDYYKGNGILDTKSMFSGNHRFAITIEDYYGNSAILHCEIEVVSEPLVKNQIQILPFALNNNNDFLRNNGPVKVDLDYFPHWLRITLFPQPAEIFLLSNQEYHFDFSATKANTINRINFTKEMVGDNSLVSNEGKIFANWTLAFLSPDSAVEISSQEGEFKLYIPLDAVYESHYLALTNASLLELNGQYNIAINSIYRLEPAWMPLKRRATLRWEIADSSRQIAIYRINSSGGLVFLGNERDSTGIVIAKSADLGTFAALYDRYPPTVRLVSPRLDRSIRQSKPEFRFKIGDDLSGISSNSIEITIDGEWVLAEYDQSRHGVKTRLRFPLSAGSHELVFKVNDKCGNETVKSYNFRIAV